MANKKLSDRERKFCYAYIKLGVGKSAAISAGYSEKTARRQASRLLTKDHIINKLNKLRAKFYQKLEISVEKVLNEYAKLAFSEITEVMDITTGTPYLKNSEIIDKNALSAIQAISETKEGVKIKMHDKKGALDALGRHLGIFAEDNKREVEMKVGKITKEDAELVNDIFKDITE